MKFRYGLDPAFELCAIYAICNNPKLFGRLGIYLDPDALGSKGSQLAIKAAKAIYADLGRGPDNCLLVIQRLVRWRREGKITSEEIDQVNDIFDFAENQNEISEESIVNEIKPLIQEQIREEAVKEAIKDHGKRKDLSHSIELEKRAMAVGEIDQSLGCKVGVDSLDDLTNEQVLDRLPLKVPELDNMLEGGLQREGLGTILAESGSGKSMFLTHVAAVSALQGYNVCFATLEISRSLTQTRLISAITEIPIRDVLGMVGDSAGRETIKQSLAGMSQLGSVIVQEFVPDITAIDDITNWAKRVSEHYGVKIDLLVVDYADKLTVRNNRMIKDYDIGKFVWNGLRAWAVDNSAFVWTASQSRGRERQKPYLDLGDFADSIHKARISDMVITLNPVDSDESSYIGSNRYYIAKHRTAHSGLLSDELETEYHIARIAKAVL